MNFPSHAIPYICPVNKLFRILGYLKGYQKYALLNILCNLLSVVFSLFSLTMVIPFLNLLFISNPAENAALVAKGQPLFEFSAESFLQNFNYFLGKVIEEEGRLQGLIIICVLVVVVIFMKNLFRYLALFFIAPVRNGVVRDLRNHVFEKALDLPLGYHSEERKGDIMSRMTNDVNDIELSILQAMEMIFRDPVNILMFLLTLIFLSPQLTLILLVLLPVTGFLIARIAKSLKRTSVKGKEKMGIILSIIDESLTGLRIVLAFNARDFVRKRFRQENEEYFKITVNYYRRQELASPLSEFMGVSVLVVIMYFGGQLVLSGSGALSASVFITYIAIFSQIIPPIKNFTNAYYNIQKGLASGERIRKITDALPAITEKPNPTKISGFEKAIVYDGVHFSYGTEGAPVLKGINLEIPKGKTIALVGPSGGGKSTLADLLPRFYDPIKGRVTMDGIPLTDLSIHDLRANLGIVTQESILFNDTVFNNIAFGMPNVKQEAVEKAAIAAHAHEFIAKMEQGYQTNIGDRGVKLSGGQRQRLSLARAILKNPPILILDEATSALDAESEKLVQAALDSFLHTRTSLVIAHRLSTIRHADEIIVLEKGEIVERGTHTDLLSKNGIYKRLTDAQSFF